MSVAVEFHEVIKSFGPVRVLHGVSLALEPGRVYGLLGENGAGKSTLMKILAGYEALSGGEVRINGRAVHFSGSRAAEAEGIVLIHQEFNLADDLTIAQNIFLGHEKKRGWLLDDETMRTEAAVVLEQVGLKVDPDTKVRNLIVAEKQLVEIAKALARKAKLLIMDEPTATLTPGETERLFKLIAQLNAGGVTVLYISHKLDEVERITHEVIVMRDGRFVARELTRNVSRQQMANLMVGRELSDLFPPKTPAPRETRAGAALAGAEPHRPGLGPGCKLRSAARRDFGFCRAGGCWAHRVIRGAVGSARAPCRSHRTERSRREVSQSARRG